MGSYYSIAEIAEDEAMTKRMYAAVTQEQHAGNFQAQLPHVTEPFSAQAWVDAYKYVWASSPGWSDAWDSALAGHPNDSNYKPGEDPGVITDGMILAAVQAFGTAPAEG